MGKRKNPKVTEPRGDLRHLPPSLLLEFCGRLSGLFWGLLGCLWVPFGVFLKWGLLAVVTFLRRGHSSRPTFCSKETVRRVGRSMAGCELSPDSNSAQQKPDYSHRRLARVRNKNKSFSVHIQRGAPECQASV